MLPFFKPLSEKVVMWVVLVIVPLLFAVTIGCSSQPEVVVVEKEVVREVVVTATPVPTPAAEDAMVSETATPTPEAPRTTQTATRVALPTSTPTSVIDNYYVHLERVFKDGVGLNIGVVSYFADFPSLNLYHAEKGDVRNVIQNYGFLFDYLLKQGMVRP